MPGRFIYERILIPDGMVEAAVAATRFWSWQDVRHIRASTAHSNGMSVSGVVEESRDILRRDPLLLLSSELASRV